MKITGIDIKRFGVWRDLSQTLGKGSVSVVYGPNEAGKTTLLRFIRGILYGFDPFGFGTVSGRPREYTWEGALRVSYKQQPCEIRRVSSHGSRGLLSVTGLDREEPAESLLHEMLSGTDERIFENVLAVGLQEIQELATLQEDEVARHIYGMTLGPGARRLLDASAEQRKESDWLLDPDLRTGVLVDCIAQTQDLAKGLEESRSACSKHAELTRELNALEDRVEDMKDERAELEHRLRGHEYLDHVWTPWKQVRDYENELAELPDVADFPSNGLAQLDSFDARLDSLTQLHSELTAQADELRTQSDSIQLPPLLRRHAATMQSFVDQRDWLEEAITARNDADARAGELHNALVGRIAALGPEWSQERLGNVDMSPEAQHRLMSTATQYRAVLVRRARLKHLLKRLSTFNHQQTDELNGSLRELGSRNLDESLASARRQVGSLAELSRLRMRANELESRRREVNERIERLDQTTDLPKWFPIFLAILAFAGLGVTLLGLHFGLTVNALGGASFALLGLTGLGIVWGFRSQIGSQSGPTLHQLQDDARHHESSLTSVREEITRLSAGDHESDAGDPSDLVRGSIQRLTKLERLAESQERLLSRRRRLSDLRLRFRGVQREVAAARQNWCDLLTRIGLTESVHIDAVLDEWRSVADAEQCRREWQMAEFERKSHRREVESFLSRLRVMNDQLERTHSDDLNPLMIIAGWKEELSALAQEETEIRRLREEEACCRAEAAERQAQIDTLERERSALLAQGGAADREEFVQRASIAQQREEFAELLALAREELETAAGTAPDLAVVEEDLENYDAEQNAERIAVLQNELEELEQEFHASLENCGRVKEQLRALEEDDRPERLRIERAESEAELRRAAEEWLALQVAGHALGQVRGTFERTCQPPVLASASRYLERLTRGRYRNVWSPLGRRELRIDDDHGLTFGVEQLSGGTREQLFLAVRLAVIRELTRQGIELPVVLDDILVNFDQIRTEAAVDTLLEFAGEGQQILFFTCHLHLAHLFESRGVEPIWLPGHNPPIEERLAG